MRILSFVVAALAACAVKPSFDESTCPFALHSSQVLGQTVRCGVLKVPEQHDSPFKTISVPVLVFNGSDPSAAPIVNLAGGPGQSWKDLGLERFTTSTKFSRDYVFIEQRGTGLAEPKLDCPEGKKGESDAQYIDRCVQTLQDKNIVLEAYNTRELAADVEDMRVLLGYDKIILSGVSYGTAWALETMRRYSSSLSGVVLDSVVSPTSPPLLDGSRGEVEALRALFAECVRDQACTMAYGDVEAMMLETLSKLAAQPLAIHGSKTKLTAKLFFSLTMALLESEPGSVPLLIKQVHDAGPEIALSTSQGSNAPTASLALGQYLSVTCSDNQTVSEAAIDDSIAQLPEAYRPYVDSTASIIALCARWPYKKREAKSFVPVTAEVPTLILSGRVDPTTPSVWAREVASTLPEATLVEVPGVGHDVAYWQVPCVSTIQRSFYAAPSGRMDISCLAAIESDFALPNDPARELGTFAIALPSRLQDRLPRWWKQR